jgi:hypothetical protein
MFLRLFLIYFFCTPFLFAEGEEDYEAEHSGESVEVEEEGKEEKKSNKISLPKTIDGVYERLKEIKEELKTVEKKERVKVEVELSVADKIFKKNKEKLQNQAVETKGKEVEQKNYQYVMVDTPEYARLKKEREVLLMIARRAKEEDAFQKREFVKSEDKVNEEMTEAILGENYVEPKLLRNAKALAQKADEYWVKKSKTTLEKSFIENNLIVKNIYLGMYDYQFLGAIRNGAYKEYNMVLVEGRNQLYSLEQSKYFDQKEFGSAYFEFDKNRKLRHFEFKGMGRNKLFGITAWPQKRFLKAFVKKYNVFNFDKNTKYVGDEIVTTHFATDHNRKCQITIFDDGFKVSIIR